MKPIDLHNHVIPRTIINAVREQPELYKKDKVSIEQQGDEIILVLGKKKFAMERELYDPDAKVETMARKGIHVSVISPAPLVFMVSMRTMASPLRVS